MATRSRTTFKKRQKELARMEKQRDKAARRVQRRLEKTEPGSGEISPEELEDLGIGPGVTDEKPVPPPDELSNPAE
jgi:hypothetical protein